MPHRPYFGAADLDLEVAKAAERVRCVHERAGGLDAFSKYIDSLREKHSRLRALWEEVQAAVVLSGSGAV